VGFVAIALAFVVLGPANTADAQNSPRGSIAGKVVASTSGEPLAFANVVLYRADANRDSLGTPIGGATSKDDGTYRIEAAPGTYLLVASYVAYNKLYVSDVRITAGDAAAVDLALVPEAVKVKEVEVTASALKNTVASILSAQRTAPVVSDAISAEQIRLSPDGNSSEALKRVTGLSIVDDKFVFVRGVTDRYNATSLNGTTVTGTDTDTDRKSFNFDLMPASLISNMVVQKTATPDQPGDFSGGLVQVNTLDVPDDLIATAQIEAGNDGASSREDIRVAPGGGNDWTGRDDGSRALPSGLEGNDLAKALPNTWGTSDDQSRLNQTYGLAVGDRFRTGAGEIGFIASGTHKNNYKIEEFHQEPYGVGIEGDRSRLFLFDGARFKHTYLWGGLLNVAYRPSSRHTFRIENNFNRSAEDKLVQSTGVVSDSTRYQVIEWDQRQMYLGQLSGSHKFPELHKAELEWRASYTTTEAEEPDRKFAEYSRDPRGNYLLGENLRSWSALDEDTHGAQASVAYPIGKTKASVGTLYSKRERNYGIDVYSTDSGQLSSENRALVTLPIDQIFAPENYGEEKFQFVPSSPLTGQYTGTQDLWAYYGMVEAPFAALGRKLRFAGGARVEDSDQVVVSPKSTQDPTPQTARIDETDVLPSANLTYEVTSTANLRVGYFASLNRPEFREMANVAYVDFDAYQGVVGNPALKRATISNYDARMEWFPTANEMVAVSYFYKGLTDAIEEQLLPSPDRYVRTWFNSPEGKNYGYEIEVRKNLGFAWHHLQNMTVQANYTHVSSEVEYTESFTDPTGNPITESKTRTMQGQAPYTVNTGLAYSLPNVGLSMSLLYSRFGRRLDAVGDTREEDIFEESRDVLDFALTQQIYQRTRLRFTAKDMIADDYVYTFGSSGSTWQSIKVGTTYAAALTVSL
jgi:hypothetical protein